MHTLLQRNSFGIFKLDATVFPGPNEQSDFRPFCEPFILTQNNFEFICLALFSCVSVHLFVCEFW